MKLRYSGKLFPRLIACFLCMVVFAVAILAGAAYWFTQKSEENLHARIMDNMALVTERLSADIFSLFDLQKLVNGNVLIQEYFRPYSQSTIGQQYYYGAILDILWQSRLQYNGLIDSIFLYADDERVLYSASEKGMASSQVFFSKIMAFEKMDAAAWYSLLDSSPLGYRIQPPDRYTTHHLNAAQPVISLVYTSNNHGYTNVLVMNLSLDKLRILYETNAIFSQTCYAVYSSAGDFLCGWDANLTPAHLLKPCRTTLAGQAYYLYPSYLPTLDIIVVSLTPRVAFTQVNNYFSILLFALPLIFGVCGVLLAVLLSRRMYEPFRIVHESIRPYTPNTGGQSELELIKSGISTLANDRQKFYLKSQEHRNHYVSQTLASLLCGNTLDDEGYFARLMAEEYGFSTPDCRVITFILDLATPSTYHSIHEAMKYLAQTLEETFSPQYAHMRVHFQSNMYVLVLHDSQDSESVLDALCRQAAAHLAQWPALGATLRWGVGRRADSFGKLNDSFDSANSAIFALNATTDDAAEQDAFQYDRRDIISAASTYDVQVYENVCREILCAAKRCHIPYPLAAATLRDIFATVAGLRQRSPNAAMPPEEAFDPMAVLLLSPQINTAPLISASLPYLLRPAQTKGDEGMKRIALRLKAYIDENYAQELSLDVLADALGLSAKYLSRVFKLIMGINLSDYLAYVRMEKAKELLLTPLPIEHIAQQVGIINRTTFTRTFRKLEGMTPSEYRRLHQEPPTSSTK